MADPACSAVSIAHDEPLQATASIVRSWLLVEHPGAWGPDALNQSGLPAEVVAGLAERSRKHGFRVLLLRRPERPSDGSRHCFVAHSGRGSRWIREGVVENLEELLDLDFSPLGDGEPVGFGAVRAAPLYLVCTNGRHDQCCATRGRPLAQAMDRVYRDRAWESSHVGGCRFAGNLVCFPHGLYFGEVEAGDGPRIAADYERGLIDLDHYRGRPSYDTLVQAAECFVRRAEGLRQVDDLVLERRDALGDREVSVQFAARSGIRYRARVRATPAPLARRLTCHATGPQHPPVYDLLDLQAVAAAS